MGTKITGEAAVEYLLKSYGWDFAKEKRFHPTRRWRFDFVVLGIDKVAIEVEGGIFSKGRHTRGSGYIGDMEKYNEAALMGWKVLRYPAHDISTRVIADLERLKI
jgi:very-short-patch-repair endonuclease